MFTKLNGAVVAVVLLGAISLGSSLAGASSTTPQSAPGASHGSGTVLTHVSSASAGSNTEDLAFRWSSGAPVTSITATAFVFAGCAGVISTGTWIHPMGTTSGTFQTAAVVNYSAPGWYVWAVISMHLKDGQILNSGCVKVPNTDYSGGGPSTFFISSLRVN